MTATEEMIKNDEETQETAQADREDMVDTESSETKTSKELTLFQRLDQSAVQVLRKGGVEFDGIGCKFQKGISAKGAAQAGTILIRLDQVVGVGMNFSLGDWWNWIQTTHARHASQILEAMPEYKYETIKNYGSVASKIPHDLRTANINWTIYTKLAPCDADYIVKALTGFREGILTYDDLVKGVEAEQQKRIQEDKKKRLAEEKKAALDAQKKAAKKAARNGEAEGSEGAVGATETGAGGSGVGKEGAADSSSTEEAEKEEMIGVVISKTAFDMLIAAEKHVRKVLGSKAKLTDSETLSYILAKFCSMNRLTVKGLVMVEDEEKEPVSA